MLDPIPVPFLITAYPLAAAAIILTLGRFLPHWVRRLLAVAATVACLAALWSLRTGGVERVEIFWEPLNFFRTSPTLHADSLSLLGGIALAVVTAATALGIRDSEPQGTAWHGLILVILAGCLITTMAANLLTLALGSALIDLVLIALVLLTAGDADRTGAAKPLVAAVPGMASTLLLFLGALRMDTQVGHTSLLAQNLPQEVLTWVGVAGVLRLLIFPLQPRGWNTPQKAASLLPPVGVGIYLLARVETLAPILADQPWMLTAGGIALLAGGLLAWSGASGSKAQQGWPGSARLWFAVLVHQTGQALAFVILLGGTGLWPLLGLALPLAALAIWWDSSQAQEAVASPRWLGWLMQRIQPWWAKARFEATARFPILQRWRNSWWNRHTKAWLAIPVLVSLAGGPLTLGFRIRWPFYAILLKKGEPSLLLALVADAFLVAGLWAGFGMILKQAGSHRLGTLSLLAMIILVVPIVVPGIAPGILDDAGLKPITLPDISVWGLGFIFVLPWLLGIWLASIGAHLEAYLDLTWRIVNLDWLYRATAWIGQRLAGAVYWLGQVGEGEGWWGWALIILALGTILVTAR